MTFNDALSLLAPQLALFGFDILGSTNVAAYNDTLDERLADRRLTNIADDALVVVIGNTRRLWPLFIEAFNTTSLGEEVHPLDAYSRLHIAPAVARTAADLGVKHEVRFSFDPPPNTVAIQRLAESAGVGEIGPVGLCVHPQHGPWFSLRAAAVFEVPGPAAKSPAATCSACSGKPCLVARERVVATVGDAGFVRETFVEHWRDWLAMRDACPVGSENRYSEQQIRYHYLKELNTLRQ